MSKSSDIVRYRFFFLFFVLTQIEKWYADGNNGTER